MGSLFIKSLQSTGLSRLYEVREAVFLTGWLRLVGGDSERPEADDLPISSIAFECMGRFAVVESNVIESNVVDLR
jgi:hypothetical protein